MVKHAILTDRLFGPRAESSRRCPSGQLWAGLDRTCPTLLGQAGISSAQPQSLARTGPLRLCPSGYALRVRGLRALNARKRFPLAGARGVTCALVYGFQAGYYRLGLNDSG